MSTARYVLLSSDDVMSVRVFKVLLNIFSPSFVLGSHLSVRSISSILPDVCSTLIVTFSEFRNLHTVAVDSRFRLVKIFFPAILLTSVDFPELVSPEKINHLILQILFVLIIEFKNSV